MHVGTAGWSVPLRYQDKLPAGASHLERYSQRLNAVEINSSFHRHHRVQTYARWAASVPPHFRFSVKVPRTLTHEGELLADAEILDQFAEEVSGLGDKLAVLLVQLPPRMEFDASVAGRFFTALRKRIDVQFACEPRHSSWRSSRADKVLAKHAVARVAADPSPWPGSDETGGWAKVAYFRWHGSPRRYYSDYDPGRLASLEKQVTNARELASDVWVIFDNTVLGCALGNALAIADALQGSARRTRRRKDAALGA
jgi:uncharacterized protein YecE (DUF72 family)